MSNKIVINYDDSYDDWYTSILRIIQDANYVPSSFISNNILYSLQKQTKDYLLQMGYRPADYLSYRKELVKRLAKNGLVFDIVSNDTLWNYLSVFTDAIDYSECFDIGFKVVDLDLVKNLYLTKQNNEYVVALKEFPGISKRYGNLDLNLKQLKEKYEGDTKMQDIFSYLQLLIDEEYK